MLVAILDVDQRYFFLDLMVFFVKSGYKFQEYPRKLKKEAHLMCL